MSEILFRSEVDQACLLTASVMFMSEKDGRWWRVNCTLRLTVPEERSGSEMFIRDAFLFFRTASFPASLRAELQRFVRLIILQSRET